MWKKQSVRIGTFWVIVCLAAIALALPLRAARLSAQDKPAAGEQEKKNEQDKEKKKASKPLAGYTAAAVEPFTVENSAATKDFPAGEEANLRLSVISALRANNIFSDVSDAAPPPAEKAPATEPAAEPPAKPAAESPDNEVQRRLILSATVTGFSKGSSGARFMTWPLPVGVSKARAVFVLRDAQTGREVFRLEKEAKFQAAASGGIATKEEQLAHVKGGLVEALIKEIKRNR
jgi:hypothetical protein